MPSCVEIEAGPIHPGRADTHAEASSAPRRPLLAARGRERRDGNAQGHALEAARAGGAEVEGPEPPPPAYEQRFELLRVHRPHHPVLERAPQVCQVVTHPRPPHTVLHLLPPPPYPTHHLPRHTV